MPEASTDLLSAGRLLAPSDLADAAAEAVRAAGVTQKEVAETLGQSAPAVSRAVNGTDSRGHALRVEIIERYGGVRIAGPLYRVEAAR